MNTDREAMKLALEAFESYQSKMSVDMFDVAITALRQALLQPECNPHPDAPHGFNRESSHSLGRYVCDCEGWAPEEQKSVSYIYEYTTPNGEKYYNDEYHDAHPSRSVPVYLTPPQREWVGLTDEEVNDLKHWLDHRAQWSYIEFASAIEAKLKEKNCD